jgi:hypothetical protein
VNQSTRIRIACTTGLLALLVMSGPASATYGKWWGHRDNYGNKCKTKKNHCRYDKDCKSGFFCDDDHQCKKKCDDFCRTDRDCKSGFECGRDHQCRKKEKPPTCRRDADCPSDKKCGSDGECHSYPCDDDNACTVDGCSNHGCTHTPIDDCTPCETAAQCDDGTACTTDLCSDQGICDYTEVDGCVPCTTAADCADGDDCTAEACGTDGSCQITAIPGCGVTTTTSTTSTTLPPTARAEEICGDCVDNNGDGLTDFEDPSCCAMSSYTMNVFGARVTPKGSSSKLRLTSRLVPPTLHGVTTLRHDVYVQIRPVKGQDILCARIPMENIKRTKRVIKFSSKRITSTKGINKLKIVLNGHRGPMVKIAGKKVALAGMSKGAMQISLAFYNPELGASEARCSMAMSSFRAKGKKSLVTP